MTIKANGHYARLKLVPDEPSPSRLEYLESEVALIELKLVRDLLDTALQRVPDRWTAVLLDVDEARELVERAVRGMEGDER